MILHWAVVWANLSSLGTKPPLSVQGNHFACITLANTALCPFSIPTHETDTAAFAMPSFNSRQLRWDMFQIKTTHTKQLQTMTGTTNLMIFSKSWVIKNKNKTLFFLKVHFLLCVLVTYPPPPCSSNSFGTTYIFKTFSKVFCVHLFSSVKNQHHTQWQKISCFSRSEATHFTFLFFFSFLMFWFWI